MNLGKTQLLFKKCRLVSRKGLVVVVVVVVVLIKCLV